MPWLSARELAGLPGMPSSEFRTRALLMQLGVPSRRREGRGGGREFDASHLPAATRRALLLQAAVPALPAVPPAADLSAPPPPPAPVRPPPTHAESACADARVLLLKHLDGMSALAGGALRAADLLAAQLHAGDAPAELLEVAAAANQRPRTAAGGGVAISSRTLRRWAGDHRRGGWHALLPAPVAHTLPAEAADDVAQVLARYHSAAGHARNLTEVAQAVTVQLGRPYDDWRRLYDRARRLVPRLDRVALVKARHTGAERDARLPYRRRDTSVLRPLDVALVDGHSFKAKVRHPVHGQPFAPELTVVIDAATRKVTGWSVALSENTIAVGDAIRHAVTTHGIPAIAYTDGGPGETARQLDCPVAGLFARLGIEHRLGLPGKPQGHGLIERSWQTFAIRCARQFGSYQGSDADSGRVRAARLEFAREQTALKRAESTGEVVRLSAKAPSWQQFFAAVGQAIEDYNTCHRHRGLPKHASGPNAGRHMTPAEAWAAMLVPQDCHRLGAAEARHAFMPSVLRVPSRGWVSFLGGSYFCDELMRGDVDGRQVRVAYDLHDASRVWVWTLQGEFVCEASATANRMGYFPEAAIERARRTRVDGIVKRRQAQIDTALRELQPVLPAAAPALVLDAPPPAAPGPAAEPQPPAADGRPAFFESAAERYEWLLQHRAAWAEGDAEWLAEWTAGADYAALRDYFASRGLAWPDEGAGPAFKHAG